jgi:hypothetical protein
MRLGGVEFEGDVIQQGMCCCSPINVRTSLNPPDININIHQSWTLIITCRLRCK